MMSSLEGGGGESDHFGDDHDHAGDEDGDRHVRIMARRGPKCVPPKISPFMVHLGQKSDFLVC